MGSNEQFGINNGNIHQGGAEEVTYTGILHSYWSILSQSAGSAAPFYHNLQGLQGTLRQKRLWPEGIRIHQRNVVSSLPKEKTVRLASVYASCRKRACILQTKYPLDHFYTWISAFNCLEQYSAELACVLLPTLNSFYSCDKPSWLYRFLCPCVYILCIYIYINTLCSCPNLCLYIWNKCSFYIYYIYIYITYIYILHIYIYILHIYIYLAYIYILHIYIIAYIYTYIAYIIYIYKLHILHIYILHILHILHIYIYYIYIYILHI